MFSPFPGALVFCLFYLLIFGQGWVSKPG